MSIFSGEVVVWQVFENMTYFDKELNSIREPVGYIERLSSTYDDELWVIHNLRFVRDALIESGGNEDVARNKLVIDIFELMNRLLFMDSRPCYLGSAEFDFWLKIYNRRFLSRSLVLKRQWSFDFWVWLILKNLYDTCTNWEPINLSFGYEL